MHYPRSTHTSGMEMKNDPAPWTLTPLPVLYDVGSLKDFTRSDIQGGKQVKPRQFVGDRPLGFLENLAISALNVS